MNEFESFEFSPQIKRALKDMDYRNPTEVQLRTIPLILDGYNVAAKSYTGSGKTAAFGIPLSSLIADGKKKSVLIVGPTRELVVQVKEELRNINRYTKLRIFAVYGGHGIEGEIKILQGKVDMLCATPGRLLDHIERGTINLRDFDTVVLDEADRMLDMGFVDDVRRILAKANAKSVHLFSATLEENVISLIKDYVQDYETVTIKDNLLGNNIIEKNLIVQRKNKFRELINCINKFGKNRALVFVSTKRYASILTEKLNRRGYRAVAIHGDLSQKRREISLGEFKSGRKRVLVATDVAARGLQIDNVECVVNYDAANDADTHKHRIGRTGRMGNKGYAITFLDDSSGAGPHSSGPKEFHGINYYIERGY